MSKASGVKLIDSSPAFSCLLAVKSLNLPVCATMPGFMLRAFEEAHAINSSDSDVEDCYTKCMLKLNRKEQTWKTLNKSLCLQALSSKQGSKLF